MAFLQQSWHRRTNTQKIIFSKHVHIKTFSVSFKAYCIWGLSRTRSLVALSPPINHLHPPFPLFTLNPLLTLPLDQHPPKGPSLPHPHQILTLIAILNKRDEIWLFKFASDMLFIRVKRIKHYFEVNASVSLWKAKKVMSKTLYILNIFAENKLGAWIHLLIYAHINSVKFM